MAIMRGVRRPIVTGAAAVQAKLDELIRAGNAKNAFIGIDHLTEAEVQAIRARLVRAQARSQQEQ
jgi:low affinity Fe/Cu permease